MGLNGYELKIVHHDYHPSNANLQPDDRAADLAVIEWLLREQWHRPAMDVAKALVSALHRHGDYWAEFPVLRRERRFGRSLPEYTLDMPHEGSASFRLVLLAMQYLVLRHRGLDVDRLEAWSRRWSGHLGERKPEVDRDLAAELDYHLLSGWNLLAVPTAQDVR